MGGHDGKRELASVLRYDPAGEGTEAGPWSTRAPMNQLRGGLGATVIGKAVRHWWGLGGAAGVQ